MKPKPMKAEAIAESFGKWIDGIFAQAIPEGVVAFTFNLYEHENSFAVELVGCPRFDPDDPDWASEEFFAFRQPVFEIPHQLVGTQWQKGLAAVEQLVRRYLRSCPPDHALNRSEAIAVGFVDGDLSLV